MKGNIMNDSLITVLCAERDAIQHEIITLEKDIAEATANMDAAKYPMLTKLGELHYRLFGIIHELNRAIEETETKKSFLKKLFRL